MPSRVIAIDWSGAAHGAARKIWLAEVDPRDRRVIRLESGRSRSAVARHLIQEAARDPEMVVGLDFAFSLPMWFLEQRGLPDAPALWDQVAEDGERWLTDCVAPFWGRPGTRRPKLPAHFRLTDSEVPAVNGIRPKSVFQIGGAGAVGTGSLRGMPILKMLRDAGFAIWPFDAARFPMVVEIYPRALTGAVAKANAEARRQYLTEQYPTLDEAMLERAVSSDDAFDALVSVFVMAEHANEFATLLTAADDQRRREGQIWLPAGAHATSATPRRPYDSSRTRVAPVFDALEARQPSDPLWLARLLDLAAGDDARDRPWQHQDMRVTESYWAPDERGLQPPVALLSWLIRNFDAPPEKLQGNGEVVESRRKLAEGDPDTIDRALRLLRRNGTGKGWYVLEGRTYPDALLITRNALVVVEGKRTETGPTTGTTWMACRHQMLRHLDAAWEIRGRRAVYGLYVVEGECRSAEIPEVWRQAARDTTDRDVLRASLPHRSGEEQRGIASAFVGVTTWHAIRSAFSLDAGVLVNSRVPEQRS